MSSDDPRPPTVGPVPDAVPRESDDRPWSRTLRAIEGGRAGIRTIGAATAYPCKWGGCNGTGVDRCDRCGGEVARPGRASTATAAPSEHLTPAATRLITSGIGAMREIIGDGCTSATPPLEVAYLPDGRFSVAVVLTGPVARLNEYAATEALSNGERRVREVLATTWQHVDEIAVAARMDRGDVQVALMALWRVQLAHRAGETWKRAEV